MEKAEALWRQYELHVDLYKYYLKLALEFNFLYYAITGAILSYYFAHSDLPLVKYSLVLPVVMSVLFCGFFMYGAYLIEASRTDVFQIRDSLKLDVAPDLNVLSVLLRLFAALMCVVAVAIVVLMSTT